MDARHPTPGDGDAPDAGAAAAGQGAAGAPAPGAADAPGAAPRGGVAPSPPGGLLDVLNVAAVVLDDRGRIVLWSPQAEDVFGYRAEEALGRYAGRLLVREEHLDLVVELFARVMHEGLSWAGVFPVRHKDGGTRLLEFRNMRLRGESGDLYALGLATDQSTLRAVERDVALSTRLVAQSPIGLAVLDTNLRFLSVNPALARLTGVPAEAHVGRALRETMSFLDTAPVEAALRRVLGTGAPLVDQTLVGRVRADPEREHAWSVSYYRLEAGNGKVLGLAVSVVDITDRYRAATEAARARRRLALVADASVRVGTTLDLRRTARELADLVVPQLADAAAVDVLDAALRTPGEPGGPGAAGVRRRLFRPLAAALAGGRDDDAGCPGAPYEADDEGLVARCVATGEPYLVRRVAADDLPRLVRGGETPDGLARAGLRSYLVVPLTARGTVLGALSLRRTRDAVPFDDDDLVLARELAGRAAVAVDNARWYQREHDTVLTLQRSLLPHAPEPRPGLELAHRYEPAGAAGEVGGDWFDVIPLAGGRTALVVGDVMGSGVSAATTMGQLRTAARALADLDLDPADLLRHVDRGTTGLRDSTATCVYGVYDPRRREFRVANAGHLPPVRVPLEGPPRLLDLPTGVPLGVGGVPFDTTTAALEPGDRLVLYTDGLIEVRGQSIDARLEQLLALLRETGGRSLDAMCDEVLDAMREPDVHDDVALLVARVH
ncbi:SpoIIE family protein phosphatase [Streptomyces sp. NPDC101145]|uniref:SpoIIE family protein phosphatase n=1 Tax=Streptomyces sp. NPDC101145 TaxID=3366112 RepID=UPI00382D08DE